MALYNSVLINCQLNEPNVLVSLWQRPKVSTGALIPRLSDGKKLFQSGQVFLLSLIDFEDEGDYFCIAVDESARKTAFKLTLLQCKKPS